MRSVCKDERRRIQKKGTPLVALGLAVFLVGLLPELYLTSPLTRLQVAACARCWGVAAMLIDPSLEHGVFGPEATAAMGEAFDAACKELHEVGQLQMVRKVIAQRIIAAARGGELDPVRLRAAALSWIISQMSPAASR